MSMTQSARVRTGLSWNGACSCSTPYNVNVLSREVVLCYFAFICMAFYWHCVILKWAVTLARLGF